MKHNIAISTEELDRNDTFTMYMVTLMDGTTYDVRDFANGWITARRVPTEEVAWDTAYHHAYYLKGNLLWEAWLGNDFCFTKRCGRSPLFSTICETLWEADEASHL